jgi:hypothetical protein
MHFFISKQVSLNEEVTRTEPSFQLGFPGQAYDNNISDGYKILIEI